MHVVASLQHCIPACVVFHFVNALTVLSSALFHLPCQLVSLFSPLVPFPLFFSPRARFFPLRVLCSVFMPRARFFSFCVFHHSLSLLAANISPFAFPRSRDSQFPSFRVPPICSPLGRCLRAPVDPVTRVSGLRLLFFFLRRQRIFSPLQSVCHPSSPD